MTSDIQLVNGQFGDTIKILILKVDGTPDDLTVYPIVRFVLSTIDFSTNIYNLTGTDIEINETQFSEGILGWTPSVGRPVPAQGDYWIQVFRESPTQNKPVRKFFLQVTRGATQ